MSRRMTHFISHHSCHSRLFSQLFNIRCNQPSDFSLLLYGIKGFWRFYITYHFQKKPKSSIRLLFYCPSLSSSSIHGSFIKNPLCRRTNGAIIHCQHQVKQNLILDLDPAKYDVFLQPLVECLWYSPLVIALMKSEIVLVVHLSKAYSTASYQKGEEMITFEIFNKKTQITKSRFCSLLGLAQVRALVDPEYLSNSSVVEMFY